MKPQKHQTAKVFLLLALLMSAALLTACSRTISTEQAVRALPPCADGFDNPAAAYDEETGVLSLVCTARQSAAQLAALSQSRRAQFTQECLQVAREVHNVGLQAHVKTDVLSILAGPEDCLVLEFTNGALSYDAWQMNGFPAP